MATKILELLHHIKFAGKKKKIILSDASNILTETIPAVLVMWKCKRITVSLIFCEIL